MKRIVLFWIPLLLLLLVNCTTESFDFDDQEGILVEGSGGGGSSQPNPTITEGSEDLLGFTIAFDESDRTTYGSRSERWTGAASRFPFVNGGNILIVPVSRSPNSMVMTGV